MSDTQLSHTRLWRPPEGAAATAAPGFSRGSRGPATAGGRVSVSEDSDVAGPVQARPRRGPEIDRASMASSALRAASNRPRRFASLSKSRSALPYTSRKYSIPRGATTGVRASTRPPPSRMKLPAAGSRRVWNAAGGTGHSALMAAGTGRAKCPAGGTHGIRTREGMGPDPGERAARRRGSSAGLGRLRPIWGGPTPAHRGCGPLA